MAGGAVKSNFKNDFLSNGWLDKVFQGDILIQQEKTTENKITINKNKFLKFY